MKALCTLLLMCAVAQADPPYRLWWSMPHDDVSAIEVDDADLGVSEFSTRWELALKLANCNGPRPARKKDLREVRIETLDGVGQPRSTRRCVFALGDWRVRLGERMVVRLEDELDAHISFLHPRKVPGVH